MRPVCRPILPDSEPLLLVAALARRDGERVIGEAAPCVLRPVEDREVAPDSLTRVIAEYPLGAWVPGDELAAYVQHEYAKVTDATDERPEAVLHHGGRDLLPLLPGSARERAHHRHEERRGLEERELIKMACPIGLCR